MLQQARRICRRFHTAIVAVIAGAWLMFGVAPCLMAAPADDHGNHDCPHCETEIVVAAPACDLPADIVPVSDPSPDWQPALPVGRPLAAAVVSRTHDSPPIPAAPHERPLRQRYCRLLE